MVLWGYDSMDDVPVTAPKMWWVKMRYPNCEVRPRIDETGKDSDTLHTNLYQYHNHNSKTCTCMHTICTSNSMGSSEIGINTTSVALKMSKIS